MMVANHFVKIQYECGMQSVGFAASTMNPQRHSGPNMVGPNFPRNHPCRCTGITVQYKGAPICPATLAYQEGAKTLCKHV
jgi:hypothetical protein